MNLRLATIAGSVLILCASLPASVAPATDVPAGSELLNEETARVYVRGVLADTPMLELNPLVGNATFYSSPESWDVDERTVDTATSAIMAAWSRISTAPEFTALATAEPRPTFFMEFAADHTGILRVAFVLSVRTPTDVVTSYWDLDLTTGERTGPHQLVTPRFDYISKTSQIWAGREWGGSPQITGYAHVQLYSSTIAEPLADLKPVDRVGGAWLGVTRSVGGGGSGLLQIGLAKQTKVQSGHSPMPYSDGRVVPDYGWWLMCIPDSSHSGFGPQPFVYGDASTPGHWLRMYLRWDNGAYGANTWKTQMWDTTSGVNHVIYADMNNCAGTTSNPFQGWWAQTIVEPPTSPWGVVQIPRWYQSGMPSGIVVNSINFWWGRTCTAQNSCTYEHLPLNYNDYTLSQYPGNANTGQAIYTSGSDYAISVQHVNSKFQCGWTGLGHTNEPC